ncbi:hypothetical protein P5673_018776, partial [Acropora cervicornis]
MSVGVLCIRHLRQICNCVRIWIRSAISSPQIRFPVYSIPTGRDKLLSNELQRNSSELPGQVMGWPSCNLSRQETEVEPNFQDGKFKAMDNTVNRHK